MFNGPGINWWGWGAPPGVVPPSGPLTYSSRYEMGYRSGYVIRLVFFTLGLLSW